MCTLFCTNAMTRVSQTVRDYFSEAGCPVQVLWPLNLPFCQSRKQSMKLSSEFKEIGLGQIESCRLYILIILFCLLTRFFFNRLYFQSNCRLTAKLSRLQREFYKCHLCAHIDVQGASETPVCMYASLFIHILHQSRHLIQVLTPLQQVTPRFTLTGVSSVGLDT